MAYPAMLLNEFWQTDVDVRRNRPVKTEPQENNRIILSSPLLVDSCQQSVMMSVVAGFDFQGMVLRPEKCSHRYLGLQHLQRI